MRHRSVTDPDRLVEARRMDGVNGGWLLLAAWLGRNAPDPEKAHLQDFGDGRITLSINGVDHVVNHGDLVLLDDHGEFSVVTDEEFSAAYEFIHGPEQSTGPYRARVVLDDDTVVLSRGERYAEAGETFSWLGACARHDPEITVITESGPVVVDSKHVLWVELTDDDAPGERAVSALNVGPAAR